MNYVVTIGLGGSYLVTQGYGPGIPPVDQFSLSNWREWVKHHPEVKAKTDYFVKQAIEASTELIKGADESLMLLQALEARQAYEDLYFQAFQEAYVAELVGEMWKADMLQMRNRMATILLLLDQ